MKILFTTLAVAGAMLLAAGTANAASPAQCQAYAQQQAAAYAPGASGGAAVTGGVIGAIAGGLLGSANGNNAAVPGAIIGGVGGAMVGGAASQAKYNQVYQQAYALCMNQGAAPVPVVPQPPVVGPAPGPQAGVYQALNVRTCASTSCPVLGVIQPGSIVSVSGCSASWCQVGIPQGWGWASRKYLYF